MWLTSRLVPDHKTIAGLRKDDGTLGPFMAASVAIDGSKLKAVNNRDKNFPAAHLPNFHHIVNRVAAPFTTPSFRLRKTRGSSGPPMTWK